MDPARWAKVEEIFHGVCAELPADQERRIVHGCGGDRELEAEVRSLVRAAAAGAAFIEIPAGPSLAQPPIAPLPERVGAYRVLRRLASGGMGDVYLAQRDDEQFDKQVAIKIIRSAMASEVLVRRFVQERQILAALEHPNIARLIDGGATPEGLPYLVMEYVDGRPVDQYARDCDLSLRARFELVRQACEALAFAHRNLVIHRDVKPGNMLVTAGGQLKLLDFGIAKLVAPDRAVVDVTATGGVLMTLEYASPEQVQGGIISTATDVYSLGVVMYRLVTGQSPYQVDTASLDTLTAAICFAEPPKPSLILRKTAPAHAREVSRDVDAIILKALRKEPSRRYSSVEQLADDIARFTEGRPVLARPGTWSYRAGKFVARHRIAMVASALAAIATVSGVSMIVVERGRAVRRFNDVRELAHSVVFDYHDAIEKLPGATPVRERLVKDALKYLDSLAADATGDTTLQRELAEAYQKIGDIQGNSFYANLGQTQQGIDSHRKSLALREALYAADRRNHRIGVELARSHDRVGDLLWASNDLPNARDHFQRAIDILEPLGAAESPDVELRIDLGAAYEKLADVLGNSGFANLGDTSGALTHYRRSLAIREAAARLAPGHKAVRSALFGSHQRIAAAFRVSGDFTSAISHVTTAVAIQEEIYRDDPAPSEQRVLGIGYSRAADEFDAAGQADTARDYTLKAVRIFQELFAKDATNARAHRELGVMTRRAGRLALKSGHAEIARQQYASAIDLTTALMARDPANAEAVRDMFVGEKGLGDALAALGRHTQALSQYRSAIRRATVLLDRAPGNMQARSDLALAEAAVGTLLLDTDDAAGAAQAFQRALVAREAILSGGSATATAQSEVALVSVQLGHALKRLGRGPESRDRIQRGVAMWKALDNDGKLSQADKQRLREAERALR